MLALGIVSLEPGAIQHNRINLGELLKALWRDACSYSIVRFSSLPTRFYLEIPSHDFSSYCYCKYYAVNRLITTEKVDLPQFISQELCAGDETVLLLRSI